MLPSGPPDGSRSNPTVGQLATVDEALQVGFDVEFSLLPATPRTGVIVAPELGSAARPSPLRAVMRSRGPQAVQNRVVFVPPSRFEPLLVSLLCLALELSLLSSYLGRSLVSALLGHAA